jgi:hypothetical protein
MNPAFAGRSPCLIILALLISTAFIEAAALPAVAADKQPVNQTNLEAIDRSLQAGVRFLVREQSEDGAWRSRQYPVLADGLSLTPLVLRSLRSSPESEPAREAWRRGADYLLFTLGANLPLTDAHAGSLNYGLYSAAGALVALPDTSKFLVTRQQCRQYLLSHQLREPLGWRPGDPEYGGWGYARRLPDRPPAGQPLAPLDSPNLSATVFALEALRSSELPANQDVIATALRFVMLCQNYGPTADGANAAYEDGGFFFVLDDPTRNKAGVAGIDNQGRTRFRSYASATADGLRALRLCGLAADHPRVAAARTWLKRRLEKLGPSHSSLAESDTWRQSSFFYSCWSISLCLDELSTADADVLAQMLLDRQQPDGSWANPAVDLREDDKLVATAFAIEALRRCRQRICAL